MKPFLTKYIRLVHGPEATIEDIRKELLYKILILLNVLSLPAILIAIIEAVKLEQYLISVIYAFVYSFILIAYVFRRSFPLWLSVSFILLTGYVIGVINLLVYGFSGAAIPLFFAISILSAILLGIRKGLVVLFCTILAMAVIGFLFVNGSHTLQIDLMEISTYSVSWLTAIVVLFFLGSIMIFGYGLVQYNLVSTLNLVKKQAEKLEQVNQGLEVDILYKDQLNELIMYEKNRLEESEKRFRSIVSNAEAGYFFIDNFGHYQDVNDAWLKLYKYEDKREVISKHYKKFHTIDEVLNLNEIVQGIQRGDSEFVNGEVSRLCKDGSVAYHRFSAKPVIESGKIMGVEGFIIDSTSQRLAKLKLQELNDKKDKFFSIIAHDLKNPFNSLLGFSDMLVNNHKNYDEEKMHSQLELIHKSAQNAYKLLEDLLEWSKTQSSSIPFQPKALNLVELCSELIEQMKNQADSKQIALKCFLKSDEIVFADPHMLSTVLRNLISNAIKFTNPMGQVDVYLEKEASCHVIAVADNGVGIDPSDQRKLWDISESFTRVGTASEKGSGLGLIICKEFIEKHGGQIWVESALGEGSDFKFSLPYQT